MKKRAVVGVGVAGFPEKAAGNSWAFLQWGLGLRELGWEVWLVESLRGEELKNRQGERTHLADSVNLIHWKQILREIGWDERATLLVEGEKVDEKGLRHFAEGADLFLNLSGHFKRPDLVEKVASRVYVDLDPAFTQIWAKVYQSPMNFSGHNTFWSVGLGMGRGAVVPDTGHTWKAVVPPVCRKYWTREAMGSVRGKASELSQDHWTTVAHWYGYATVEWEGRSYSNKAPEFEILRDWPKRSGVTPRVVTDLGVGEERSSFEKAGWQFVDPLLVCSDWQEYRAFLATSRGEFSPAKGGYVTAKTGWFSDRSVLYLSLGRPVLLQETGWSKWLPEGMGLVTFRSLEEAVEKVKLIEKDYGAHCAGAEKVAAEFLDARRSIPQALAWL